MIPSAAGRDGVPSVSSMRLALFAHFALFGVVGTQWYARLPSVRSTLGLDAVELGGLLTVGGLGTLAAVLATGGLVARFGGRRVLAVGVLGNVVGFGLVALGLATLSIVPLAVGLVVNGACGAFVNVPINVAAAAVERRIGRTVLPHFHATFSVGAAVGSLIAAGFSWRHVSVEVQLVVVLAVATVLRLATLRVATAALDEPAVRRRVDARVRPAQGFRSALGAWTERRTLLLGFVLVASSLSEGSAGTWLPIAITDGFGSREAVGAIAYGTFVVAMTVVRFSGTGLVDRFGRVAVVRASGLSAFVGLAVFALAPSLATAWIGIVAWGAGAALVNPVTIAAASDEPLHAAARVSVATSFSTVAMLAAPPVLGALVDGIGARHALGLLTIATLLSFSLAGQLPPRANSSAGSAVQET